MEEAFEMNMAEAFTNKMDNEQQNKVIDINDVYFDIQVFERIEKEDITIDTIDLENWGIFDPNKYKKEGLIRMIREFLEAMDLLTFRKRVKKLKH